MTRARNIAGFSTITTTPSPVHVGPIGVLTATRIDGAFNLVDLDTRDITAQGIGVTNLQVSGITTGLNVSGIITAQNGINFNGTSTGLNVSGVTTVADLTATTISIGGTLTYEDVTSVDSVGVVTAGKGVRVTAQGINVTAGISTFKGANFNGGTLLKEKVKITAGKLSDNLNIDLENGMVHHFTTAETAAATPNIRVSSSVSLNSMMAIGETITISVITTAGANGFSANWTIDGAAVTEAWNGGTAPSAGGSSGKDFYTLNIIKTADATLTVLANVSNFA